MMLLFRRPQTRRTSYPRRPAMRGLRLEALESRDCPAVAVSSLSVTQAAGHYVNITGVVQDSAPANDTVTFGGIVNSGVSVVPHSDGTFSTQQPASAVGVLSAVAHSAQTNSPQMTATLTNSQPSLTLSATWASGTSFVLAGTVTDENAANLTVTFTG